MGHWVMVIFLAAAAGWIATAIHGDKDPVRKEACLAAGGDGRYEAEGLFGGKLWCAHENGALFRVWDPPLPVKKSP